MVSRLRLAAAALMAVAVLASCSSAHSSATPAPSTTTSLPSQPPVPKAWSDLLDSAQRKGPISPATAMQAFDLAAGPLPRGSGTLADGSIGVQWAVGEWAALDTSQRRSVMAILDPATKSPALSLTALAERARSQIASAMGRDTSQTIRVVLDPLQMEKAGSLAFTALFDSSGAFSGRPASCVIYVSPLLLDQGQAEIVSVIDHQVFHCFEADDFSTVFAYARAPAWLVDGASEWAGDALEPISDPWYVPYLTAITTPLFQRTYDAVGFFAYMAQTGTDPWSHIDSMLKARSSAAAYVLATNRDFQDSWASSLARQPFGTGWDTSGPGLPKLSYHPPIAIIRDGSTVSGNVSPYANALAAVDISADVVDVNVSSSYGRLHAPDGSEHDGTVLNHAEFCVTSTCSACPDLASLSRLPTGPAWLAVTGNADGGTYSISGANALCAACPVGQWTTTSYSYTPPPGDSGGGAFPPEALSGGAGIAVAISASGAMTIDYSGADALSVGRGGTALFAGQQSGRFGVPGLSDKTGTFAEPAGHVTLSLHLDPSTPRATGPVTFDPFGGPGPVTWTCSGATMSFTAGGPSAVHWTLSRNP